MFVKDFEEPLRRSVEIYITRDRGEFLGVLQRLGGSPMTGTPLGTQIGYAALINVARIYELDSSAESRDLNLFFTTCHEIGHVYQHQLNKDRNSRAHNWIIEGHVDLLSFYAAHEVKLISLPRWRRWAASALKKRQRGGRPLPTLREMATPDGYDAAAVVHGGDAIMSASVLAVEELIKGKSNRALVTYYRGIGSAGLGLSREEIFSKAFGMTVVDFEARVRAEFTRLIRDARPIEHEGLLGAIKSPDQARPPVVGPTPDPRKGALGDARIIPGDRLGPIRLGMTVSAAEAVFGRACSRALSGPNAGCNWVWLDQQVYQTADGSLPWIVAGFPAGADTIQELQTNIRQFVTNGGNRIGERLAGFEREFGSPLAVSQSGSLEYDEIRFKGISVLFHKPSGLVHQILVFR